MVSAAVGLPNDAASNTRWVPRLGRSLIEVSTSAAHTPVALITARAARSMDSPVSSSVSRTDDPVASDAPTRVRIVAPCWRRGARHRDHQAGVVDQLAVVGQQRAVETVAAHGGRHRDRLGGTDPARPRQHRRWGAGHGAQHVAGLEAHPHQRPLPAAHRRQQRHQLRHRLDQVRAPCGSSGCRVRPNCAGRCRRCRWPGSAEPPWTSLELHRLVPNARSCLSTSTTDKPAAGSIQGDAGAGDAATDDDDVDGRPSPRAARSAVRRAALRAEERVMRPPRGAGIRSGRGRVRRRGRRRRGSGRRSGRTGSPIG